MSPTATITLIFSVIGILILAGILFKIASPKKSIPEPPIPEEKPQEVEPAPTPEIAPTLLTEPEPDNILQIEEPRPLLFSNIEPTDDEKAKSLLDQFGNYDHTLDLASYKYPPLDLLNTYTSQLNLNAEPLDTCKNKIVEVFRGAKIAIDKIRASIGPTMTLYEIIPALGTRVTKIKSLENDIALALAAHVTITGIIPGKGSIGIEVLHSKPDLVTIRSVLSTERYQNTTMDLPVTLGKTMAGEVFIADLAAMPHLLIAGATGQGKSVSINAILLSLLYKKHPAELKFVLIDINKLELTLFRKIERHFLAKLPGGNNAIITAPSDVTDTLNSVYIEADQRFELLRAAQLRHIKEYNEKFINQKISHPENHRYLPHIVIVIDEFAELLKSTEQLITSLAQKGRPIGIHLIISTQRPSVNIITGSIKANFSSRLAFRLVSSIDSRTILDSPGAELLHGQGDMLYSNGVEIIHLQGALVTTQEIERVCDFIGNQHGYPSAMLLPAYGNHYTNSKEFDPDNLDPMFEEAARLIVLQQQGSTSLIQRKMKLGYNRTGRIIDQMEAAGIVGPFEGSKARDVLFPDEYSLERHLEDIRKKKTLRGVFK